MIRALLATLFAAFLAACGVSLQAPALAPAGGYELQGLDGSTRASLGAVDGWVTFIDGPMGGTSHGGAKPPRPMPRRTPGFPF
jgi:hypothetical protein